MVVYFNLLVDYCRHKSRSNPHSYQYDSYRMLGDDADQNKNRRTDRKDLCRHPAFNYMVYMDRWSGNGIDNVPSLFAGLISTPIAS